VPATSVSVEAIRAARAVGDAMPWLVRAKSTEIVMIASELAKSDELPADHDSVELLARSLNIRNDQHCSAGSEQRRSRFKLSLDPADASGIEAATKNDIGNATIQFVDVDLHGRSDDPKSAQKSAL
jgi:hypothetical protein